MRRETTIFLTLFLSTLLFASSYLPNMRPVSAAVTSWEETLPYPMEDHCTCSLVKTIDGSYAIATTSYTSVESSFDFQFFKISSLGSVERSQSYGTQWSDDASIIIQTDDGGYAIGGLSSGRNSAGDYQYEFLLIKIGSSGEKEWEKTFTQINQGAALLVKTDTGGFAIAGSQENSDSTSSICLIKIDSSGNTQWNKCYPSGYTVYTRALINTADGGYAIASAASNDTDTFSLMIVTDSSGNSQWNKTYSGNGENSPSSIVQNSDGGYTLAGSIEQTAGTENSQANSYSNDAWLLRIDSSGNQQWSQTYSQPNGGMAADSLILTEDGGYAFAGYVETDRPTMYSGFETDFCLVKLDSSGGVEWSKTYGGERRNIANSLIQAQDGGYLIAGTKDNFGNEDLEYYVMLVKTDEQGEDSLTNLNLKTSSLSPDLTPSSNPNLWSTIENTVIFNGWILICIVIAVVASTVIVAIVFVRKYKTKINPQAS